MSGDEADVPCILALCNPLLDISAYVEEDLLEKYNLKPNNVILAGEEHKNLCKELVERYPVDYTAGGSAQNVMRVAAGIFRRQQVKAKTLFTGCIGDDEFGAQMTKKAQEDGVETYYAIDKTEPTGTCAVCLTEQGKNRSLCAFLGASQKFSVEHLKEHWDKLVARADMIYFSGFLLAVSPASYELLGEHIAKCADKKKRFCLNLSAPYISAVFGADLDKAMKYTDIVFGNDDEVLAYAKHKNWSSTNIDELAKMIVEEPKARPEVGRLVVVTQGERPIVAAQKVDGKLEVRHFECKPIPDADMVDTNGAGDSFAGAFLSQYIQNKPIDFCVEIGSYAAREIIKLSGIVVPDFADIPVEKK